jgi:hypothetical protein
MPLPLTRNAVLDVLLDVIDRVASSPNVVRVLVEDIDLQRFLDAEGQIQAGPASSQNLRVDDLCGPLGDDVKPRKARGLERAARVVSSD